MPRYSVDLSINTKGYTEGIDQAKQANAQFDSTVKETDNDVVVLTKELRRTKKEAQNLAAQYMLLSKAEKESALGQDLKAQLDIAIEKAAEFQDVLSDVNEAIKNAASDTAGWDALKETMEISKSTTLAVAGAFSKVTGDAEGLQNMIKTLTVVENGFNAVIKIGNALQAQSKTMLALRRAGIISTTQAQKLQTIATTAATGATKGLGLAMKALPLLAIVGAIMAVGSALINYTKKSNDASKASISQKKELTSLQKALNDISNTYTTSYTNALGSTLSKYEALKRQYLALSSRKEQIEWFKEHKKECQNLEVGINNLIDVDKAFTSESEKVIKVLRIRALMTAEAARNAELYAKMMQEIDAAQKNVVKFNAGDQLMGSDIERYGLQEGKDYIQDKSKIGVYQLTDEGARKASDEAAKKNIQTHTSVIEDALKQSNTHLDELAAELQEELGSITTSGSKSGANKEQLTYLQQLVKAAEEAKKKLEDIGKTGTQEQINAALTDYENKLKEIEDYKIKIGLVKPDDEVTAYIKKLKENLKEQEKKFQLGVKLNDKKMQEEALAAGKTIQDELDTYTFNIKVKPKVEKSEVDKIMKSLTSKDDEYNFDFLPDKYRDQADKMLNRLNELTDARKQFNEILEESDNAEEIEKANVALAQTKKEYDDLTAACNRFNDASAQIQKRTEQFEEFNKVAGSIDGVVGSINNVVGAMHNLTDAFKEDTSGWEKFIAVWDTLMTVLEAVATVIQIVNTIQDIKNAKDAASQGLVQGEAIAHGEVAGAQVAEIATTGALAAEQTAAIAPTMALYKALKLLAGAQIFAAHAAIPFAGVPIASGFVAQMEGVLAGLMAFAHGGIVGGNSFYGDHILARVNSGEMILTKQQQKNLFDAIDNNKFAGGNTGVSVSYVKVKGSDIVLALKNQGKLDHKTYIM